MSSYGKYRGKVFDNNDPKRLARLRLYVPSLFGNEPTGWALPNVPFGGFPGGGFVCIPPVGSMVWVEFEEGDTSLPIWTGCFWLSIEGSSSLPVEARPVTEIDGEKYFAPNNYVFKTSSGQLIEVCDVENEERIRLETMSGVQILLDDMIKDGKFNWRLRLRDGAGQIISMVGREGAERIHILDKEVDKKRQELLFNPVSRFFRIREVDLAQTPEVTLNEIIIDNKSGQEKIKLTDKSGDYVLIDAFHKKIRIVAKQDKEEVIGKDKTESIIGNKSVVIGGDKGESISGQKVEGVIGNKSSNVEGNWVVSVVGSVIISSPNVTIKGGKIYLADGERKKVARITDLVDLNSTSPTYGQIITGSPKVESA